MSNSLVCRDVFNDSVPPTPEYSSVISNFDRLKSDSEEFCRSKDDDGGGKTTVIGCGEGIDGKLLIGAVE
jgi:hypothetical protein